MPIVHINHLVIPRLDRPAPAALAGHVGGRAVSEALVELRRARIGMTGWGRWGTGTVRRLGSGHYHGRVTISGRRVALSSFATRREATVAISMPRPLGSGPAVPLTGSHSTRGPSAGGPRGSGAGRRRKPGTGGPRPTHPARVRRPAPRPGHRCRRPALGQPARGASGAIDGAPLLHGPRPAPRGAPSTLGCSPPPRTPAPASLAGSATRLASSPPPSSSTWPPRSGRRGERWSSPSPTPRCASGRRPACAGPTSTWGAGTLRVASSVVEVAGKLIEGPPKTAAGRRAMTMPASVMGELEDHLDRYAGPTHVFCAFQGGLLRPDTWRALVWRPAVRKAGLRPLRIHDLKHTRGRPAGGRRRRPFGDLPPAWSFERRLHLRPLRPPVSRGRPRGRQARRPRRPRHVDRIRHESGTPGRVG